MTEKHGRALHLLQKTPDLQAQALTEMTERELSGDQAMELARTLRSSPSPATAASHAPVEYKTDTFREARAAQKAVERLERRVGDEGSHGRLPALRAELSATVAHLRLCLTRIEQALEAASPRND